jgi:N-acetylglucosaminyl-diphospho-decaprenol L-rhamnosyltransferase
LVLSVIIVSYNVKHFLEHCLLSLQHAMRDLEAEVIVVDNHSSDGSVEFLQQKFPWVKFICNETNVGYARANNVGWRASSGRFLLFLNPDTIVPEDGLLKMIVALEGHPGVAALGVKMIDGSGTFLQESKRGEPTAWNSFCKMSGLTSMFPRSKWFAGYYAGHISDDRDQEVEILSGACLLAVSEVVRELGGFDERFFMYAEDIDLSHRIRKVGYKNLYYSGTTILHFKGESTVKDQLYVSRFYNAMQQYVEKYKPDRTAFYTRVLRMAISLAAIASRIRHWFRIPSRQILAKKVFITGDPSSREFVSAALSTKGYKISNSEEPGCAIVLCQGGEVHFKNVIAQMAGKPGQTYFIHAKNSSAIISSSESSEQGQVISLNR